MNSPQEDIMFLYFSVNGFLVLTGKREKNLPNEENYIY